MKPKIEANLLYRNSLLVYSLSERELSSLVTNVSTWHLFSLGNILEPSWLYTGWAMDIQIYFASRTFIIGLIDLIRLVQYRLGEGGLGLFT